jgi:hypothetical protein
MTKGIDEGPVPSARGNVKPPVQAHGPEYAKAEHLLGL